MSAINFSTVADNKAVRVNKPIAESVTVNTDTGDVSDDASTVVGTKSIKKPMAETVTASKDINTLIPKTVTVNKDIVDAFDDASTVVGTITDNADSDVDSSSENRTKNDKAVEHLIAAAAFSSPCNSPKKKDEQVLPSSSPVRKTNWTAKSTTHTLKRQRSTQSIREDREKAPKKPRRKANLASKKEAAKLELSTIAATRSVPPELKFVFEIGRSEDEQRVLRFTSDKNDIPGILLSIQRLKRDQQILKRIGHIKANHPSYFGITKVIRLTNAQKLDMIKPYPYLTIRALQQGLADYAFHAIAGFQDGPKRGKNTIVARYECGMVGCGVKMHEDAVMLHMKSCKELKKLEERVKKANAAKEEEDGKDLESEEEL